MLDAPDKEPDAATAAITTSNKAEAGSPLSGISRAITDEELQESSGARKLLLYAYDKMERECEVQRDIAMKFHNAEKELAGKDVELKQYKRLSNAEDLCKVVGGAILGFAANHLEKLQWWLIGLLALVLILGPFYYHHKMVKDAQK